MITPTRALILAGAVAASLLQTACVPWCWPAPQAARWS